MLLKEMELCLSGLLLVSGVVTVASGASVGGGEPTGEGLSLVTLSLQKEATRKFMEVFRSIVDEVKKPRCPEPYFPVNNECFYINTLKMNITNAKIACQQLEGYLAEPENVFILSHYLKEKTGRDEAYFLIGGHKVSTSSFKYFYGRFIDDSEWSPGNPNLTIGEDCLGLKLEHPPLADFHCHILYESICEYGPVFAS